MLVIVMFYILDLQKSTYFLCGIAWQSVKNLGIIDQKFHEHISIVTNKTNFFLEVAIMLHL